MQYYSLWSPCCTLHLHALFNLWLEVCIFWFPSPPLSPPASPNILFSVSVSLAFLFCFLNATCKWYHDICLSLTDVLHFSVMPWISTHVVADGKIPFSYFLMIIHPVYIPQFFIHSLIHELLGCFCVLAILNNAAWLSIPFLRNVTLLIKILKALLRNETCKPYSETWEEQMH